MPEEFVYMCSKTTMTTYAYDGWGNLVETAYSDDTPTVTVAYDALGRQVEAHDAAGVTTFAYDTYGANTNETVIGVAGTNFLERFTDAYGRDTGYALNGVRQTILGYDEHTGRLATMATGEGRASSRPQEAFSWNYVEGTDLKSQLAYPNGLTASWTYDANNQLLQVRNATPTNVISQYDYTYDAAGRRIACARSGDAMSVADTIAYAYNVRGELTNALSNVDANYAYSYQYDDIGNRLVSCERGTNTTYAANELNQYTSIVGGPAESEPEFDDDGNQTLIRTATGMWRVTYNGENRPVHWQCGNANVVMSYDCIGRRVIKDNLSFAYKGYLQISDSAGNAYVWDPFENIATRPLVWKHGTTIFRYTHDGHKNVSEVLSANDECVSRYEYAPFGAVIFRNGVLMSANLWCMSSEFVDDEVGCDYYNYRHYEPITGRWLCGDILCDSENLYAWCKNASGGFDLLGLKLKVFGSQEQKNEMLKLLKKIFGEAVQIIGSDVVLQDLSYELGCECRQLICNGPTYSIVYDDKADMYGGGMFTPEPFGGVLGGGISLGSRKQYSKGNQLAVDFKFPFVHMREEIESIDYILAHELAHAILHQKQEPNADKRLPSGDPYKIRLERDARRLTDLVMKGCRK